MMGDLRRYSNDSQESAKEMEETRSTNSVVENYFGIIKQDIAKKKRLRPGEFIRKQYVNVKGKLAEIETLVPSTSKVSNTESKQSKDDEEQWKPKKNTSKKKISEIITKLIVSLAVKLRTRLS